MFVAWFRAVLCIFQSLFDFDFRNLSIKFISNIHRSFDIRFTFDALVD